MMPDEYLALPEEKPYLEYVDGMVLQKPMPNNEHAELVVRLGYLITVWIASHGGRVGTEARSKLGELPNYRLPDLSFWRAGIPRSHEGPATLAVEVRSRDQTRAELRRKCEFMRASGVEACWLIDPISREAWLYEGDKAGMPTATLYAACMPGFELPLGELFAVLDE